MRIIIIIIGACVRRLKCNVHIILVPAAPFSTRAIGISDLELVRNVRWHLYVLCSFNFFLCTYSRHECLNRSRTTRLIHIKCIDSRSRSTNCEHYSQTSFQMQTQGIWIPFGIAPFSVQWMLVSLFVFYYRMLSPTYQSPGCWFSHVEVSLLNWNRACE